MPHPLKPTVREAANNQAAVKLFMFHGDIGPFPPRVQPCRPQPALPTSADPFVHLRLKRNNSKSLAREMVHAAAAIRYDGWNAGIQSFRHDHAERFLKGRMHQHVDRAEEVSRVDPADNGGPCGQGRNKMAWQTVRFIAGYQHGPARVIRPKPTKDLERLG